MGIRIPPARSIDRTINLRTPKVEIVIACEGKNTEPLYFARCADYYGNGLVKVTCLKAQGVPLTLVRAAIAERQKMLQKYRKSPDSYDHCFKVWAAFDKDNHPQIDQAMSLAKANKIEVAFSNPCFELWPLLHLRDHGSQCGRHEVQRYLQEDMPTYHHQTRAEIDFELIKDDISLAMTRADKLNSARIAEQCIDGCPSTTVNLLVKKIIENGKSQPRPIPPSLISNQKKQ